MKISMKYIYSHIIMYVSWGAEEKESLSVIFNSAVEVFVPKVMYRDKIARSIAKQRYYGGVIEFSLVL